MTSAGFEERGLRLVNIHQSYGKNYVIKGVSLFVKEGEFLTLLGPSGSGKTTLLNIIAGFLTPSQGSIELNQRSIVGLPPEKRNFGLLFQGYALFPHLNVFENVAFPLRVRKVPKETISAKVRKALEMVQLVGLEDRLPKQLSGGQQQRVALARVLVFEPLLLLLDEPLGALDKKLREELQVELKMLHRRLGSTFIYVTHDQEEALSMSDRIAVMNEGIIEQVGAPLELYEKPASIFVANFLGHSNIFHGKIVEVNRDTARVELKEGISCEIRRTKPLTISDEIQFMVRPERIKTQVEEPSHKNRFYCRIIASNYFGDSARYLVELKGGKKLKVRDQTPYARQFKEGDYIWIWWGREDCVTL